MFTGQTIERAVEVTRASVGLPVGSRVVAAMSGGVDSSVVAALLKHAGYDVVGVTLQLYDHGGVTSRKGACCAGKDILDARNVASALSIPHFVLDYEARFQSAVIDNFADTYVRGETPVPCIRCNQTVKFRDLLGVSRDLGADALATGHYTRRTIGPAGPKLARARDAARDQSYFLFATTRAQLDYLRFPLGDMGKDDVRAVAGSLNLEIANKADSQDICFVPEGRYVTIIDRLRPSGDGAGEIVHVDGRVLGRHLGVSRYTIGQRRGLNIAIGDPLFVIQLDAQQRRVIVGPREALFSDTLTLADTNWLGAEPTIKAAADRGKKVVARVRSTRPPAPATLSRDEIGAVRVVFEAPEEAIAPGQACVLYDASDPDWLLGGGFIASRRELVGDRLADGGLFETMAPFVAA